MHTFVLSPKSLLCPISPLRVGETTARLTGLLAAALIGVYALTGAGAIMLALAIDYGVRAGSRWRHSPLSWLAAHLVRALHLPNRLIDKAPKMFAARIGLLFALASSLLALLDAPTSLVVALVLLGFALLEALLNICVGCLAYTYVMLPLFKNERGRDRRTRL
jgi:uncharacterized protein DUF4395